MDTRASIVDDASLSPLLLPMLTPPPLLHEPKSFEDNLRQESLLIPEDIEDIHIEAAAIDVTTTIADTPADNTRYGKGKHWKRNLKKKQYAQGAGADAANLIPVQTERTQEQRREQIRPIIDKLTELQMNISYPAIRELYKQLNHFVKTGEDAKIKIPFPEFSRKIKGELSNAPYIPCWVKLEME
jgi:cell division protein FtsN